MYIWSPINALYPGEGAAFGDDDLRPPRSSGDILFPGIFTSRYITYRLGPDGVGVMLGAQIEEKGVGPLDTCAQHRSSCLEMHMHVGFAFLATRDLILYCECKTPGMIVIFYSCVRDKKTILYFLYFIEIYHTTF